MPLNFKFVSVGQTLVDAATVAQTLRGNSLKPLAPVNLRGTRNTAGDLTIEWDRRSRIAGGLRPFINNPIAEEAELYEVEIYDGADVVDTFRVSPSLGVEHPLWQITKDVKRLTSIGSDGTVRIGTTGSSVGNVLMVSQQSLVADEDNLISFTVNAVPLSALPKNIGLLSEASLVDDLTGIEPEYGWARGITSQILTMEEFNFDPNLTSSLSEIANTRLTIQLKENAVTYYQDREDNLSPTVVTQTTVAAPAAASGAYRLYIRELTGNSKAREVVNVEIHRKFGRAVYTAEQQTVRFGSAQSSIKVRVYQISALVGRGAYSEANL